MPEGLAVSRAHAAGSDELQRMRALHPAGSFPAVNITLAVTAITCRNRDLFPAMDFRERITELGKLRLI
jgi:hypothetical protein